MVSEREILPTQIVQLKKLLVFIETGRESYGRMEVDDFRHFLRQKNNEDISLHPLLFKGEQLLKQVDIRNAICRLQNDLSDLNLGDEELHGSHKHDPENNPHNYTQRTDKADNTLTPSDEIESVNNLSSAQRSLSDYTDNN